MKNKIKSTLIRTFVVVGVMLGLASMPFAPVNAGNDACPDGNVTGNGLRIGQGAQCSKATDQQDSLFGSSGVFTIITNVLLFIVGAIAVIMLIIGGIRYTISGGAKDQVESAKNTIMYAIIGIIVVILAFAIVNFVITNLVDS